VTREQLDAIRARVEAALTYEQSEYVPEEGAYVSPATEDKDTVEWMTCPLCDGDGEVEGQRYDAKETVAATVVAYGVGEGLRRAEEWVENAPADMRTLLAEVERLRDAHAMAVQVSGELCEKCGWAMKFPGEKCRCELLAEVERLTAELHRMKSRPVEAEFSRLDTMWQQLVRERDEAAHELSRLKGVRSEVNTVKLNDAFTEGTLKAGEAMRPLVAAAFSRGVAAMREAAARRCEISPIHGEKTTTARKYADAVRALPDPEDTE
jgi:hypothetical protein